MTGVDMIPTDCESLVDVGCGNGAFIALAEQARTGVRMVGVEPSGVALDHRWCAAPVVRGFISNLPFPDRSFDLVASMAVLEHVPRQDVGKAVAELIRISRRYILLDLPYRELRTRIRCDECGCGFDPQLHLRSYDPSDIQQLFAGFVARRSVVLRGEEAVLAHLALRIFRYELSARYFPHVVCPQCGYHTEQSQPQSPEQPESRMRSALRRLWLMQPRLSVDREIFVLFERAM
jgi:SAM-dependent methyltransferase